MFSSKCWAIGISGVNENVSQAYLFLIDRLKNMTINENTLYEDLKHIL